MLHAIRYCNDRRNNSVGTGESFDTAEMLPDLYEKRETPAVYFFTPVFFENTCFGYAALQYTETARSYDETFRKWIGSVCRGFEVLLRIDPDYCGRITLEDVYFSNIKNRPCIELGEHCDVTLVLHGNNTLFGSGILVPESARLVIEGEGSLTIALNAAESFGIGNTHTARHGKRSSVGILESGIDFNMSGDHAICFGTLYGASDIQVGYSSLRLTNAGQQALIFGGYDKNTTVRITNSDTKANLRCAIGKETFAPDENIVFINGRRSCKAPSVSLHMIQLAAFFEIPHCVFCFSML
ncbi:MAG: hypothetical protein IKQ91_07610 [Oscillospiraceae bacterium]|nr:hypothetical protein [Oscillospiraceae bacterium]